VVLVTVPDALLSHREFKIVEAIFRLSPERPKVVTYEDIVVKVWQLYPDEFGLRGYSDKYPDASDVHKPLYNALKSRGWVTTGARGQKKFALTQLGWERAKAHFGALPTSEVASGRATRSAELEIRHLERTSAADLFLKGDHKEILDTDFYAFYRTSVRATPQEFEGRLNSVREAIAEAIEAKMPTATKLSELDQYLRSKFDEVIQIKSERRKRSI
jgi:hypothetical protein